MTGKFERQIEIQKKIEQKISSYPDYLKDYLLFLNGKSIDTKRGYLNEMLSYLDYLKNNDVDITTLNSFASMKHNDINRYLDTRKAANHGKKETSESYLRVILSAIRAFYDFLVEEDIIEYNPCLKVKLQKQRNDKPVVALTPEEVRHMEYRVKYIIEDMWHTKRDLAILRLGFRTGVRAGAIINLDLEDVFLEEKKIIVREKENVSKEVYLDDATVEALRDWLEERLDEMNEWRFRNTNAVFSSMAGRRMGMRMTHQMINRMVKEAAIGINKNVTTHKMRSTFATNVYEKTGDIYAVSDLLGHARIDTTKKYASVSEERRRNIIENIVGNMY